MRTISEYQDLISRHFESIKYQKEPNNLYEPIRYILSLGGKRLRPVLTLMATEVFDVDCQKALAAATAVEVFHNFSLIHDDIMDDAPLRRGNETVHEKWNINTGILSGDAMLILAYQYFEAYEPKIFQELAKLFSKTALEVCEGQQYDVDFETRDDVTIPEYLKMIQYKTAVLVGAAMKMGAIVAETSAENANAIYDFGLNLGLAFQLQDDYLDTFGSQAQVGKQIGGDIIQNKKTFLILKALAIGNEDQKQDLLDLFNTENDLLPQEKVKKVTAILTELNIPDEAKRRKQYYFEKGMKSLEEVQVMAEKKELLRKVAFQLLEREN